jgi:hypothetical protein
LHSPFVILFEQDRADEARDGLFVGEDALISPLSRSIGFVLCNLA